MKNKSGNLQEVVVGVIKKHEQPFMERVAVYKTSNEPSRYQSYSYQRYTCNEPDVDNIDYQRMKGKGKLITV